MATVKRMLGDVNRDLHVQSLSQATRRHLYLMVTHLLDTRLQGQGRGEALPQSLFIQ